MSSSEEVSKQSFEAIKDLLPNLNASHVWELINHIRDACCVIIPVWFTVPLVHEISSVVLTDEQALDIVECVNNNDMSYHLGRELVESLMEPYLPEGDADKDSTNSEEDD
jgi:hypothetical protein